MRIPRLKIKYLFAGTFFRVFAGSKVQIGSNVKILHSRLIVGPGASLKIASNVKIQNSEIYVEKGSLEIGEYCIFVGDNKYRRVRIIINEGKVSIGNHTRISCEKMWIRFGGKLTIGDYSNINTGSEIRCDESVVIGSYNQISYDVKIWDTNTHNILDIDERRAIAEKYYPYFGYEEKRPKSSPVQIGDDCWIGEGAAVLKGSNLGNCSVVGMRTVIAGQSIPPNGRVVQDIKLRLLNGDISV